MKKRIRALPLLLSLLVLSGCASLLERSYSVVEPYTDRYWDDQAEDVMRAETYQDLVNSLMMLVAGEQTEGVVRCYGDSGLYQQLHAAKSEVCEETMLGSYAVESIRFAYDGESADYRTVKFTIAYRAEAASLDSIMAISDPQSLVDLLRLAAREDRPVMTARFTYDTGRADVSSAVESLWQELCRDALDPEDASEGGPGGPEAEAGTEEIGEAAGGEDETAYPACPWTVRFYPEKGDAEIVEIVLDGTDETIGTWLAERTRQ